MIFKKNVIYSICVTSKNLLTLKHLKPGNYITKILQILRTGFLQPKWINGLDWQLQYFLKKI